MPTRAARFNRWLSAAMIVRSAMFNGGLLTWRRTTRSWCRSRSSSTSGRGLAASHQLDRGPAGARSTRERGASAVEILRVRRRYAELPACRSICDPHRQSNRSSASQTWRARSTTISDSDSRSRTTMRDTRSRTETTSRSTVRMLAMRLIRGWDPSTCTWTTPITWRTTGGEQASRLSVPRTLTTASARVHTLIRTGT